MTTMPTRQQIEQAQPLNFDQAKAEKQANIQIQVSPAGLTVVVEYTGGVSSIAAALERLRAAGVVEMVEKSRPAPTVAPAPAQRAKSTKVQPEYNDAGDPCCPKHHKPLKPGNYGLYCSAKDDTTERGYCSLKFVE